MEKVLRKQRPVIRAEVLKKLVLDERRQLFELLRSLEYECYFYEDGPHSKGDIIGEDDLLQRKQYDILAIPKD